MRADRKWLPLNDILVGNLPFLCMAESANLCACINYLCSCINTVRSCSWESAPGLHAFDNSSEYILIVSGSWWLAGLSACLLACLRPFYTLTGNFTFLAVDAGLTPGWKQTAFHTWTFFTPRQRCVNPEIGFAPGWIQPCSGAGLRLSNPD